MPVERATRRSWLIWGIAVGVYLAAVFHRSSFGVASLEAADRFQVGPAALGVFMVLQIGVYALMQIPTGLLVDRFGPRRTLTAAAMLMGTGQVLFALAESYPLGLLARAVLGCGDAMAFVSVLRLLAGHFPARRYPVLVSLTGAIGAAGALASTVPLTMLLGSAGWMLTFLIAGGVTAAYAALVAARVRDLPAGVRPDPAQRQTARTVLRGVRTSWRVAGTRLGFWVHFSTMFSPAVLGLLWGFPYLVRAQGLSERAASSVLGMLVIGGLVGSPVVGVLTGRRPEHRMAIVVGFLAVATGTWTLLLAWPGGQVPTAVLVAAFTVLAFGGPASAVGFALARDYNPLPRVGTATGVVNVGGFTASTVAALTIGLLLSVTGTLPVEHSFRLALCTMVAMLLLGGWRTLVWWRRARAVVFAAACRGEAVPVRLRRRRWDTPLPARARELAGTSAGGR